MKRFTMLFAALLLATAFACSSEGPSEPRVIPAVVPEEGSDEAALLEVFDSIVRAINSEDWVAYLERCNPADNKVSIAQLESYAEQAQQLPSVDFESLNYRNIRFQRNRDGSVSTTSDVYTGDELASPNFIRSWEKVDGKWYSNSNCSRLTAERNL